MHAVWHQYVITPCVVAYVTISEMTRILQCSAQRSQAVQLSLHRVSQASPIDIFCRLFAPVVRR